MLPNERFNVDPHGTTDAVTRSMRHHAGGREGARIMVAEDDPDMRDVVVQTLKSDGYRVSSVADGRELLEAVSDESWGEFDLIISDVRMPLRDGLEVVRELRLSQCSTPVILMTAFGDDTTRECARLLNAALLDKPFELYDLRTAVLNML